MERGTAAHRLLHRLPQGILARAAAAAALTGLLFAMPLWLLLPLGGNGILTPLDASATKVAITIVLSLVIVPVVTLAALADAQRAFAVRGIA